MPTISVTNRAYERLFEYANSFDDTAAQVIERLLDQVESDALLAEKPKSSLDRRRPPDQDPLLPEGEYWVPILESLAAAEGRKRGNEVIVELEARLGDLLTERDHDVLSMGEVRWKNRARFARLRMKELGLVSSESPRGIWEITPKGYEFLADETGRPRAYP